MLAWHFISKGSVPSALFSPLDLLLQANLASE